MNPIGGTYCNTPPDDFISLPSFLNAQAIVGFRRSSGDSLQKPDLQSSRCHHFAELFLVRGAEAIDYFLVLLDIAGFLRFIKNPDHEFALELL